VTPAGAWLSAVSLPAHAALELRHRDESRLSSIITCSLAQFCPIGGNLLWRNYRIQPHLFKVDPPSELPFRQWRPHQVRTQLAPPVSVPVKTLTVGMTLHEMKLDFPHLKRAHI
jgi:hypothetical protein